MSEFLSENYTPPAKFKIRISETETSTFTPEEFDRRRFEQDDYADALAKKIVEAGMYFATTSEGYDDLDDRDKQKRQSKISQAVVHQIDAVVNKAYMSHRVKSKTANKTTTLNFEWDTYPGKPNQALKLTEFRAPETGGESLGFIESLDDYFDLGNEHFTFTEEEFDIIRKGCYMFSLYGPNVIMTLAVRSLLKQYAAFNASNVLVSTRMLTKFPHRRILETMQFLLDVITPGNMRPGGKGILAIRKLRLVHALVRERIGLMSANVNQKFIPWQEEVWGKAINQQDMVFAIHTFSIEIIKGLQKVGYMLDVDHLKEDYYKTWHYIGRALGVKPEINSIDYNDGNELQEYIYQKQFALKNSREAPNLTSVVLAEPLIDFMLDLLPFTDRRADAIAMIRLYNDPEDFEPIFQDILGIEVHAHLDRDQDGHIVDHRDRVDFEDFLSGALTIADKIISGLYKITSIFRRAGSNRDMASYYAKIGALNRALFNKLENMSKTWKGRSFSMDDGSGTEDGVFDEKKSAFQGARSKLIKWISFALIPFVFLGLGIFSLFLLRRIAKYGNKHPRPDLNDPVQYAENLEKFKKKYKKDLEKGYIEITA